MGQAGYIRDILWVFASEGNLIETKIAPLQLVHGQCQQYETE